MCEESYLSTMNNCFPFCRFTVLSFMFCSFVNTSASAVSIPFCPKNLPRASYHIRLFIHGADQAHEDAELYNWLRFQIDTPLARVGGLRIESHNSKDPYKTVALVVQGPIWSPLLDLGLRLQLERFERNFKNSLVASVSCN